MAMVMLMMLKAFTLVSAGVILGSAGARYLITIAKTFLFALEALAMNQLVAVWQ